MTDLQLKVFREELRKKSAFWQRNQHDPYNIGNAVQAALSEISNALSTAIEAGGVQVKSCRNQGPVITVDRLEQLIAGWRADCQIQLDYKVSGAVLECAEQIKRMILEEGK